MLKKVKADMHTMPNRILTKLIMNREVALMEQECDAAEREIKVYYLTAVSAN